jgi:Terminase RNaseH-like domain
MPMPGISGCDGPRCDEVEILGVERSATSPVHRTSEGDSGIYDHGFGVGDPGAAIYPDQDPAGGRALFKREWCVVVDEVPVDLDVTRYWDLAATEKTEFNDPDWTVGIKLGRDKNGGYWLLDLVRARANPGDVEKILLNTASQDGKRVRIGFGQDPGQAGKSQALHFVRALSGLHRDAGPRGRR